jgi:hypothetical protein
MGNSRGYTLDAEALRCAGRVAMTIEADSEVRYRSEAGKSQLVVDVEALCRLSALVVPSDSIHERHIDRLAPDDSQVLQEGADQIGQQNHR